VSAAIKCDRPGCTNTRDADRPGWLSVAVSVPVALAAAQATRGPAGADIIKDACSPDCAHWLVDELAELTQP